MTLNRRRFIGRAGATIAGLGALGGTGAAATGVPFVSTFGHFDDDATLTGDNTKTNYGTSGDVPGIDAEHVDDLTLLVHGWRPTQDDEQAREDNEAKFAEADRELGGSGYEGTVIGYEWDAHRGDSLDSGWTDANRIAERNGPKLAQFLVDHRDRRPNGRLRIASHSLGTLVLVRCLEVLDEHEERGRNHELTTVHPFGSAVDHDRPTTTRPATHDAIEAQVGAAHNYYSRLDSVLLGAYEPREMDRALGRHGADPDYGTPTNYADHDVTDAVGLDHQGYLENASDLMVSHVE